MSGVAESPEEYRKRKGIPEVSWSEVGPELLEALKRLAMVCKDKYQADIIDQAIAKAEGRA